MPEMAILLGLHEGERYLRAQLDSLALQTWTDWRLVVSDDSATPQGRAIVERFAARLGAGRVQVIDGPRQGAAQNYLHLFANLPPGCRHVALCDQDDVWMPGKLARAVAALAAVPQDRPAALFADRAVCDHGLAAPRRARPPARPPGFCNALVQNVMPGNTIVLNAAAARLCAATATSATGIVAHDWWIYQIVTGAGGVILRDPGVAVLYRQHGANLVGAGLGPRAMAARAAAALMGRHRGWYGAHLRALSSIADRLTPENRRVLAGFAALRGAALVPRLRMFARLGLYRQTRAGQAMLWLQALAGRI